MPSWINMDTGTWERMKEESVLATIRRMVLQSVGMDWFQTAFFERTLSQIERYTDRVAPALEALETFNEAIAYWRGLSDRYYGKSEQRFSDNEPCCDRQRRRRVWYRWGRKSR